MSSALTHIFILGAHKSGTSLLRSLLDGHSKLSVLPIETHPFKHMGRAIQYALRRREERIKTKNEIIDAYQDWIAYCNKNEGKAGGSYAFNMLNVDQFNRDIELIKTLDNIPDQLTHYWRSIAAASSVNSNQDKIIVEKSVEHAEFAIELASYFPNAKFIHIIRNPYSNLVSLRKYTLLGKNRYPSLRDLVKAIQQNMEYYDRNNEELKENYFSVRYEDLVSNPKETIHEIIRYLGISYESILEQPTVCGQPWGGNSSSQEEYENISTTRIEKWKNEIYPIEINLINRLDPAFLSKHQYRRLNSRNDVVPLKGESFKIYLYNRMLKFVL